MKRIILFVLLLCLLSGCAPQKSRYEKYDSGVEAGTEIAYIPLDDRPINTTRATLLAAASGSSLLMPDEPLYRTALDTQPKNPNGTKYGDGEALLDWLEKCDADYYVISLDQILSGGLVNSRHMTDINDEFKRIDRLFSILDGKSGVIFDTVMRLSLTVGYDGCTHEDYEALRAYGCLPRETLSENLTIDQIIAGYQVDTRLDSALLTPYLSARARKLKLSAYFLEKQSKNPNIRLLYGIDDASYGNTVQTNEITFIKENLRNGEIFAGADELGLMSIASVTAMKHCDRIMPTFGISYFGIDLTAPADIYDIGSVESALALHIGALGASIDATFPDIALLVYGGGDAEANLLLDKYNENLNKRIPTAIIDLADSPTLPKKILTVQIDLTGLLSYSSWNTAGNSIGIALSNAFARYLYLKYDEPTTGANGAFVRSLALCFAKDVSYTAAKQGIDARISELGGDTGNFYEDDIDIDLLCENARSALCNEGELSFSAFSAFFSENQFLTALDPYTVGKMPKPVVSSLYFPWFRTFEAELEIIIE